MKKFLALMLSVICVLSLLAGCTPADNGKETEPTDSPEETPEATEPKKDSLNLTSNGKCEYTIVRPSNSSEVVKNASVALKNALSEAIGGNMVSISEDFLTSTQKPGQFEILVGQTNREESKKAIEGLKSASGFIRREIGRRIDLRHTPEFQFELDHSIEHGAHINQVLSDIMKGQNDE